MKRPLQRPGTLVLIWLGAVLLTPPASDAQNHPPEAQPVQANAILWTDPGDLEARNLYYGVGGRDEQPQLPLTFVKESKEGSSPKFDVLDARGVKWRIKLGEEAQPEVVASRLLWAVGYFANENYFFSEVPVRNLPVLHRGQQFVGPGAIVRNARIQRHPEEAKKKERWSWRNNRFLRTREFNGLRVMMALISNWDLSDENNAAYSDRDHPGRRIYEVSDVGASFGMSGKSYTDSLSKNNLGAYRRSRFISKTTPAFVDFNFPTHPPIFYIFDPPLFFGHLRMRWIGKHIPRADAKWIASLLAQLSLEQIRDAFRAAAYRPEQIEAYTKAVQARIAELAAL